MRWWFKLNNNKLYRKYNYDPNDFILKKGKMTKVFKALLYFKKFNKLKKILKKRKKILVKLKRANNRLKIYKLSKKVKKSFFVKKYTWYNNFWNKIKINYFQKKNRRNFVYKKNYINKKKNYDNFVKNLEKRSKSIIYYEKKYRKRLKITDLVKKNYKIRKRNLMRKFVWLFIKASKRKQKTWFLVRIALRKSAIYHGFKKLKKFRYIFKSNVKASSNFYNYSFKLENMLNIFLLNLNLFDNIFIVNNFIEKSGWLYINYRKKKYPFKVLKINQVVSFWPIKKVQSIFKKRSLYNKNNYLKKIKKSVHEKKFVYVNKLKMVKNIYNLPNYIFYDFQIMHFCLLKPSNHFKIKYLDKTTYSDWALESRLKYN